MKQVSLLEVASGKGLLNTRDFQALRALQLHATAPGWTLKLLSSVIDPCLQNLIWGKGNLKANSPGGSWGDWTLSGTIRDQRCQKELLSQKKKTSTSAASTTSGGSSRPQMFHLAPLLGYMKQHTKWVATIKVFKFRFSKCSLTSPHPSPPELLELSVRLDLELGLL